MLHRDSTLFSPQELIFYLDKELPPCCCIFVRCSCYPNSPPHPRKTPWRVYFRQLAFSQAQCPSTYPSLRFGRKKDGHQGRDACRCTQDRWKPRNLRWPTAICCNFCWRFVTIFLSISHLGAMGPTFEALVVLVRSLQILKHPPGSWRRHVRREFSVHNGKSVSWSSLSVLKQNVVLKWSTNLCNLNLFRY